jgi:hypothetical protein
MKANAEKRSQNACYWNCHACFNSLLFLGGPNSKGKKETETCQHRSRLSWNRRSNRRSHTDRGIRPFCLATSYRPSPLCFFFCLFPVSPYFCPTSSYTLKPLWPSHIAVLPKVTRFMTMQHGQAVVCCRYERPVDGPVHRRHTIFLSALPGALGTMPSLQARLDLAEWLLVTTQQRRQNMR